MLEARNITYGYAKGKPLYRDFSLQIEAGERVALQAPSGFGKTTLCRLLAGYEQPWEGEVLCDGEPLPKRGVCPVQLIGQHPELAVDPRRRMEDTLAEAGEAAPAFLEELGIKRAWMRRYPHELSGGELQRFCIARALAVNPRYLIADEITTMLDAVTQAQIWHFLLEWQQSTHAGMVIVTHSPSLTSRLTSRIITLTNESGQ